MHLIHFCSPGSREAFRLRLRLGVYWDGSLAVSLDDTADSALFAVVSCCLEQSRHLPPGHFYGKGWSENAGLLEALEAAGIIARATQAGPCSPQAAELPDVATGFATASVWRLLPQARECLDPAEPIPARIRPHLPPADPAPNKRALARRIGDRIRARLASLEERRACPRVDGGDSDNLGESPDY